MDKKTKIVNVIYESTNEKFIKYGYVSQKDKIYTGEEFAIAELKQRNLFDILFY